MVSTFCLATSECIFSCAVVLDAFLLFTCLFACLFVFIYILYVHAIRFANNAKKGRIFCKCSLDDVDDDGDGDDDVDFQIFKIVILAPI